MATRHLSPVTHHPMLDVRIVLVRPRNPENIGASARAMANFGFTDMAVVDPYPPIWKEARAAASGGEGKLSSPEAIGAAVRAAPVLKRARLFKSVGEAVADRELVIGTTTGIGRALDLPALYLPGLWSHLKKRFSRRGGRIAILFGSEKTGLSNEEVGSCHWVLTVPTAPGCPSLNLSQAVALVCYELARRLGRPSIPKTSRIPPPLRLDRLEQAVRLVEELLDELGYLGTWKREVRAALVRRTLMRWNLRAPDEFLLNGSLRWVLKAVRGRRGTGVG